MKICLINTKPTVGDKKKNLKKMEKAISGDVADVYVFGEMALTGYRCRDEYRDLAEYVDGSSIQSIKKIANEKSCYIIFGMPLKERRGIISNAAVMVHPEGKVSVYRKYFIANFGPFEEKLYFSPGNGLPVFETRHGKVGMCICYDLFFPELVKGLALKGADMVVCISASPTTSREFFERILPARAIENTIFMAYANLVGAQENLIFWGGGQLYGPKGNLIAKGKYLKEGFVSTEIDLEEIEETRASRPTLRDTKAEIFADLYHISKSENMHYGYGLIGLKMGKYASQKMNVKKAVVYGKEDMVDGIIFSTGCMKNKITFESNDRIGATFVSDKKEISIFLR
ncbi:MAG: carbon-nitrogen hydrolase family protein [Candidatus Thermoplasmatota archaeon]|nr:carbon-nitrogen hydrolase family protein [Candidatus Thermoplasmatota archaeon]